MSRSSDWIANWVSQMPERGVKKRVLQKKPLNRDPAYSAWRKERLRENLAAQAIRSAEMARRSELLAALEEMPSDEPTPRR